MYNPDARSWGDGRVNSCRWKSHFVFRRVVTGAAFLFVDVMNANANEEKKKEKSEDERETIGTRMMR